MAAASSATLVSVQELASNEAETILLSSDILLKYAQNILNHPQEQKYRRLRIGNKNVETLLSVPGAMQCLFDMGFEEDGEYLTLPQNSSLDQLRKVTNELQVLRDKLSAKDGPQTLQNTLAPQQLPRQDLVNPQSSGSTYPITNTNVLFQLGEREMESKIRNSFNQVLMYEVSSLQEKARAVVPRSELMKKAEERRLAEGLSEMWSRDRYLLELLNWFKSSFFQWTDTVSCESCGGKTVNQGSLTPSREELSYMATRVESHVCTQCNRVNRFPRYNNPVKLLETQRGRCGEWANCFTFICIAEGYEARFVVDWTDHVWTEVYSEVRGGRWIHLDPCENVADRPLLYEAGWGKHLTYVIAFSCDDLQDVTWRYVSNHATTLSRRKLCREAWLVSLIVRLRDQRQSKLTAHRRKLLVKRTASELVELLTEPRDSEDDLGGRTTGSEEWRRARGELGSNPGACSISDSSPVTIKANSAEIKHKHIAIKYSCALDEYKRGIGDSDHVDSLELTALQRSECPVETIKGWQKLAHESTDIARKVEQDWKKAYLARAPHANGKAVVIGWKFEFGDSGLVVDWLKVEYASECFASGRVRWTLCGDEQCLMLDSDQSGHRINELNGSTTVHLTAELSGGDGKEAWQHAQLFRQSTNDSTSSSLYPFRIIIKLKDANQ